MKKTHAEKSRKLPLYTRLPSYFILLFIVIMPLLAVPVTITLTSAELTVVPNSDGTFTDYTQHFREMFLFASAVGLILFHLGERIFPDKPLPSPVVREKSMRLPLILCGAYLLLAVISSVFSEHSDIAFRGIASENEGIAAIIGYVTLFLAAYVYMRRKMLLLLPYAALICAGIISVMFIIEGISGSEMTQLLFGITDQRLGTALLFGNSIACGDICVMLLPVLIVAGLHEERTHLKALFFIAGGTLLCVISTTFSTTAFIGACAAFALVAIIVICSRKTLVHRKNILSVIMVVPMALMLVISPESSLFAIDKQVTGGGAYSPEKSWGLTDIRMEGSVLTLKNERAELSIKLTNEDNAVISGNGQLLTELSDGSVTLDGEFSPVTITLGGRLLQLDLGYEDTIEFETTGGALSYIGINGYLVPELTQSAFPELSHLYGFATGRGHTWLSGIPMLKDSIIIGCGAGHYAFRFPHNDIVGMLNTHGSTAVINDKAHSMYLGTAIAYGIPALIVMLALIAASIKRGLHCILKSSAYSGIFISVICYLIMGIANDSSVVYTPLFWILAGAVCATVSEDAK